MTDHDGESRGAVAHAARSGVATVQSVKRASAVLSVLGASPRPLGAAEVSSRLGLNRTVVYRLLRTLETDNLVVSSDGRFSLGERSLGLGYAYVSSLGFSRGVLAYTALLSTQMIDETTWVAALAVPAENEVIVISRHWSTEAPLEAILDIGVRLPVAGSALGRSILAWRDEAVVERTIGPKTLAKIGESLSDVRRTGLAFADGEVRPGVAALASAIRSTSGEPVAALGVTGTDLQPHLHPDSEISQHLLSTARAIGAELSNAGRQ